MYLLYFSTPETTLVKGAFKNRTLGLVLFSFWAFPSVFPPCPCLSPQYQACQSLPRCFQPLPPLISQLPSYWGGGSSNIKVYLNLGILDRLFPCPRILFSSLLSTHCFPPRYFLKCCGEVFESQWIWKSGHVSLTIIWSYLFAAFVTEVSVFDHL